jgi:hypothetical protein
VSRPTWLYLSIAQPTRRGKGGAAGSRSYRDISLLVLRRERATGRILFKGIDSTTGPAHLHLQYRPHILHARRGFCTSSEVQYLALLADILSDLEHLRLLAPCKVSHTELHLDSTDVDYLVLPFSLSRCVYIYIYTSILKKHEYVYTFLYGHGH